MLRERRFKEARFLVFILILFAGGVKTEAFQTSIESSIDTTIATIGDRIHLDVIMRYPGDVHFDLPEFDQKLGEWELVNKTLSDPQEFKDGFEQRLRLELTVFDTGRVVVPAITFKAVSQLDSTRVLSFRTDQYTVNVISVLPPGTTEPKDIKPPFAIRRIIPWSYIIFALLVVSIIVGWMIFYRRWKKQQPPASLNEEFLEPPHVTAFRKLEELKSRRYRTKEEIRQYYFRLSEILREYLERRYFFKALEMTTREIREALHELGSVGADILADFDSLLRQLDLVKFAKVIPEAGEMITAWELSYRCIDRTKCEPFLTGGHRD